MIATSCFRKRSYVKAGLTPVALTSKTPKSFSGRVFAALMPTPYMYTLLKNGKNDEFVQVYREQVLEWLDAEKIYTELDGSVLLTQETPSDVLVRRTVAQWLYEKTHHEIPEYDEHPEKSKRKSQSEKDITDSPIKGGE